MTQTMLAPVTQAQPVSDCAELTLTDSIGLTHPHSASKFHTVTGENNRRSIPTRKHGVVRILYFQDFSVSGLIAFMDMDNITNLKERRFVHNGFWFVIASALQVRFTAIKASAMTAIRCCKCVVFHRENYSIW